MAALRLGLAAALRAAAPDNPLAVPVARRSSSSRARSPAFAWTDHRPAPGRARSARRRGGDRGAGGAGASERARRQPQPGLGYELGDQRSRHTPELETGLYRLVQEALTNARTHGDAAHVALTVERTTYCVRITVADDGVGFDPEASTDGFGLLGMRERAALLDGTLEIESAPGQGTTVRVTLPSRRRLAA